jgi:2-alkyl-3-oxoalkanoate reductase
MLARAVVTGAAGFIGGAVAHALRLRGDDVLTLDVRRGPGVTVADISQPGDWEKSLVGADLVVHAATVGMGGVGELPPVRRGRPVAASRIAADEVRRVVLGGTATVLDAAARAGVGRLVHMSCVGVLGPDFPDGVDETAPVGLTGDARADVLAAAEQAVCSAAAGGLPATVLRVADAYGPRAGRWTIWPVLLLRAGRFVLVDGGRGIVSPVHVDDVVSAVLAAAGAEPAVGETLHVVGSGPVTAADFFGYYVRMLGVPDPRSVPTRLYDAVGALARLPTLGTGIGARLAAGVDPRAHIDVGPLGVRDLTRSGTYASAKIQALTGWRPAVDLDDGMERTGSWLRDRGLLGVHEPARRRPKPERRGTRGARSAVRGGGAEQPSGGGQSARPG